MDCSCGGTMVWKKGRFGGFYGCSSFPKCRKTFSETIPRKKPYKTDDEYKSAERAKYTAAWCDCFS